MSERQSLLALGVTPDSIWGDDEETIVYAQVLGSGRAIIFRFCIEREGVARPQSLSPRIVTCFHELEVSDDSATFQGRGDMRRAIWSSIATVWPGCIKDPTVLDPDTVINIDFDQDGKIVWTIYRDPLFDAYLELLLRHVQTTDLMHPSNSPPPVVDISQLELLSRLGGRGCSRRVRLSSPIDDTPDQSVFVFKGIDFQTYLQIHDDDDEFLRAWVETWRRSSKMIADMPPHPNIQSPPKILVSVRSPTKRQEPTLVGHLSTFYAKGDLGAHIETMNKNSERITLQQNAIWCHQMSLAIAHTHRTIHTYHMDIKPGNFIVDDNNSLILIDWEQSGAPATTLAPEADGTWDVEEQRFTSKLVYTKYTGPPRRNMPEGGGQQSFHIWNVFPEWHVSCPRALELAEVFALGRTMWMLLSQTDDDFEEVEHPNDAKISWGHRKEELPRHWIETVERCMDEDPNNRPSLVDLVEFWQAEAAATEKPPVEE